MQQIPCVVNQFFKGAGVMNEDWDIETFEEQLNWMLYDCNHQRDALDDRAAKIIEAMEALGDYRERKRETAMGLHQGNGGAGPLF